MGLKDLHGKFKSTLLHSSYLLFVLFIIALFMSRSSFGRGMFIVLAGIVFLVTVIGAALFYIVLRIFMTVEAKQKKGGWETLSITILTIVAVGLLYYFYTLSYPYYSNPYTSGFTHAGQLFTILTICFSAPYMMLAAYLTRVYKNKKLISTSMVLIYLVLAVTLFVIPANAEKQDIEFRELGSTNLDTSYCDQIRNPSDADSCYNNVGIGLSDRAICDSISSTYLRANCHKEVIVELGDETLCKKIPYKDSHFSDGCISTIALKKMQGPLCEMIENSDAKTRCHNAIIKASQNV